MKREVIYPRLPSGHALFCDDLRLEVTGKVTIVGTYGSHLYIGTIPATIPKLCIIVTFRDDPNIDEDVAIKVLFEPIDDPEKIKNLTCPDDFDVGDVIAELTIPGKPSGRLERPVPRGFQMKEARVHIELSPFSVSSPGHLKVRAYRDNFEVRLGALVVERKDPPEEATPA